MNDSDLIDRLARIDVKLDQVLALVGDHEDRLRKQEQRSDPTAEVAELKGQLGELRQQVSDMQRVRWLATGAIAGIAAGGGGVVGSVVTNLLSGGA